VTVTFARTVAVGQVGASLKDDQGREVEAWLTTAAQPFDPARPLQTVCLVPRQRLRAGVTYAVTVTATVGGRPWRHSWHFMTVRARLP
jgi:hypothetical protein